MAAQTQLLEANKLSNLLEGLNTNIQNLSTSINNLNGLQHHFNLEITDVLTRHSSCLEKIEESLKTQKHEINNIGKFFMLILAILMLLVFIVIYHLFFTYKKYKKHERFKYP
jgi:predicted PurR-regulated permease PerM